MTKHQRLKALLKKGYFPEGLPPPFITDGLSKNAGALSKIWPTKLQQLKTKYQKYNIPRAGGLRRFYAITNPISQFYLSGLIADEWENIHEHNNKSIFALDKLDFIKDGNRSITLTDFHALKMRKLKISSCHDFTLDMDISRFYPTLYTHAIPWALHGKEWCKANLRSEEYKKKLGNRLDYYVRVTQEDQTLGIPIGPDTSRILSEIVAVATELKFKEILNSPPLDGVRHYDDVSIGIKDLGEAEKYKFAFGQALNFYELQLNQEKTGVSNSHKTIEKLWTSTLSSFHFGEGDKAQRASLDHFFTMAFDLAEQNPFDNVLNYAVKRTMSIKIHPQNWEIYEAYLLKTSRANGTCISPMVQLFADYNQKRYPLNKDSIKKFVTDAIIRHAPVAHHSELAWSLFLAKALGIIITSEVVRNIYQVNCSVCALLTLDLESKNLIEGVLDKSHWQKFLTADNLYSEMWLLAYEADLKGWLTPEDGAFVTKDPYFKTMKKLKISFYNTRKNVPFIRPKKRILRQPNIPNSSSDYLPGTADDFEDLTIDENWY